MGVGVGLLGYLGVGVDIWKIEGVGVGVGLWKIEGVGVGVGLFVSDSATLVETEMTFERSQFNINLF